MNKLKMFRGDIWQANLSTVQGNVIRGQRPVVIISTNQSNRNSNIVNVVPLTGSPKRSLPCHVIIRGHGLSKPSIALTEQILTLDKSVLLFKIGSILGCSELQQVEQALKRQMDVA